MYYNINRILLILISFTILFTGFGIAESSFAEEYSEEYSEDSKDISDLADVLNLSYVEVKESMDFSNAFSDFMKEIKRTYPNQVAAMWTESVPAKKGTVRFIGAVPPKVFSIMSNYELLDEGIIVTQENGILTMEEQELRSKLAIRAIMKLGFGNARSYPDYKNGAIDLLVQVPHRENPPTKLDVVSTMKENFDNQSVRLESYAAFFSQNTIVLTIDRSSNPMIEFKSSRGGDLIYNKKTGGRCTSGFSVIGAQGHGIISAGHCFIANMTKPKNSKKPYGISLKKYQFGTLGDAAYFTIGKEALPEFYSGPGTNDKINVTGVMSTVDMIDKFTNSYGRESDYARFQKIINVGVTWALNGKEIGNVAIAKTISGNYGVAGDSGGPWYMNGLAFGIYIGRSAENYEVFMPIQEIEKVLGVKVKRATK